jgi:hypothetical protein
MVDNLSGREWRTVEYGSPQHLDMLSSGWEADPGRPPYGVKRNPMGWQTTHCGNGQTTMARDLRPHEQRRADAAEQERRLRAQYGCAG